MRFRKHQPLPDKLPTGPLNKITDVPGLKVGHHTLIQDSPTVLRTGVSVLEILDVIQKPVPAACYIFNGFGKSIGLMQIDELGTMESHVYFTNTLSTGAVHQGVMRRVLRANPSVRTYNPVVMECNDGHLSDIGALAIEPTMVDLAHDTAGEDFAMGSVGAGTGMMCFGFKGGFGSSSRRIVVEGESFTLGSLVLSNFGNAETLSLPGSRQVFPRSTEPGGGSLIMIVATDLPLQPHQLKRVARHAALSIGLLGAPGHPESGDIVLSFSTAERNGGTPILRSRRVLADDGDTLDTIYRAAAWSTAEAILDSLFSSPTMKGFKGEVRSILEDLNP